MPRKALYSLPALAVAIATATTLAQAPADRHSNAPHAPHADAHRSPDIRHHRHGIALPAPEWMVWLAFHRSLSFYSEQSPSLVVELVTSRLGITPEVAVDLVSHGNRYSDSIASLTAQLAHDLRSRSRGTPSSADIQAAVIEAKSRGRSAQRPSWAEPGAVPPATFQGERIDHDIQNNISDARNETLQRHKQNLSVLVGDDAFARLTGWIEKDVRPNVRIAQTDSGTHLH